MKCNLVSTYAVSCQDTILYHRFYFEEFGYNSSIFLQIVHVIIKLDDRSVLEIQTMKILYICLECSSQMKAHTRNRLVINVWRGNGGVARRFSPPSRDPSKTSDSFKMIYNDRKCQHAAPPDDEARTLRLRGVRRQLSARYKYFIPIICRHCRRLYV